MERDFYERALRRIVWLTVGIGLAGSLAVLIARGVRPAAGFVLGSAISLANFEGVRRLAGSLDPARRPRRKTAALLVLRYAPIAAAVYVIVEILGVTLAAVLWGLLAAFGAVILEVLYELILYARA
jgi:hypothetical protein